MLNNAIVRRPGRNFEDGLTGANLGKPLYEKAFEQHTSYCKALEKCGLRVVTLQADQQHPDSTFVEDTAVLTPNSAILARPGAGQREDEVPGIREALRQFFHVFYQIEPPGRLDGGDVCQAGEHYFIGISRRTNEEGSRQMAAILSKEGCTSSFVDFRGVEGALHLKSGIAYIGEQNLVVLESMAELKQFRDYNLIRVSAEESYAANCVRVNDYVLLPSGFPRLQSTLTQRGYKTYSLRMSEFRKMDGGLSCLSLRF